MAPKIEPAASLNAKEAFELFSKLCHRTSSATIRNEHFERFLAISTDVLESQAVPKSEETTPAIVDLPNEAIETMADMMKPPDIVLGNEYFSSVFYPVRVLYEIAKFYNIHKVPDV